MDNSIISLFRQSIRRFIRERGFTFTALLTLALCIGTNIAIFAIIDAVLVRSLPFQKSDRLVIVNNSYPGAGAERSSASFANYWDRRDSIDAFSYVSLYRQGSVTIGKPGSPQRVSTASASPEFFEMLGENLAKGTPFTDENMIWDNWLVAIITDGFWKSEFNSDPDVIGKTFIADAQAVMVIGRLNPGFDFLNNNAVYYSPAANSLEAKQADSRHNNNFQMIARLKDGVSVENAQSQIDAFNVIQLEDDPYKDILINAKYHTIVEPFRDSLVRDFKPMLLILQGGVLFLLLIGGVNLVNLLLIRASGRSKELAICQALGAARKHIAREVLLETTLLTVMGGLLGLVVGYFGIQLLKTIGAQELPLGANIILDIRVAGIALLGTLVLGIILSIPILWFNLHDHIAPILHSVTRGGTAGKAAQTVRHVFIVFQIALAFLLLAGSAMLSLSLKKVLEVPTGFQPTHVLTGSISIPWQNYQEDEEVINFMTRLNNELKTIPGIKEIGTTSGLPFGGNINNNAVVVEGFEMAPGDSIRTHFTSGNQGNVWQALGIPLIQGRYLTAADNEGEAKVCLVDQDLADYYFADINPIGRRLCNGPVFEEDNAATIVGVVGSVKQFDLTNTNKQGAIYFTQKDYNSRYVHLAVRTNMDPTAMAPTLRNAILKLDPELPLEDLQTMEERIDNSLTAKKSPALLAGIFATVALLLASIGTYGVLSYAVAQRNREIGVRMALGAQPEQIRNQFLGLGLKLLGLGTALGLVFIFFAGRAMQTILFDMPTFHPTIVISTTLVMALVTLASCLIPALRAASVSPMKSLASE